MDTNSGMKNSQLLLDFNTLSSVSDVNADTAFRDIPSGINVEEHNGIGVLTTTTICDFTTVRNDNLEYLLLQDTNLENAPIHFYNLFVNIENAKSSQIEVLLLLIYIVGLECGFVASEQAKFCGNDIFKADQHTIFNSTLVRHLSHYLPSYAYDDDRLVFLLTLTNMSYNMRQSKEFLMSAIISGDMMIVTLSPQWNSKAHGTSVCLPISKYVLNTMGEGKSILRRLRMLGNLSFNLREKLFVPVQQELLCFLNVLPHPSLLGLPMEVYDNIFQHLNQVQLEVLKNVNNHLNNLISNYKIRKEMR